MEEYQKSQVDFYWFQTPVGVRKTLLSHDVETASPLPMILKFDMLAMMLMNASMFIHRGSWYSYIPNPIPPIPARNPLNLLYKPFTRWEAVTNEDWQDVDIINIPDEENDEDFNIVD